MDTPPRRILIADDCQGFRTLAERLLRRSSPRSSIITAQDGPEAIDHLKRCGSNLPLPDLMLLDRQMPGGDGFAVLDAVRADARLAALPVLMLSGSDDPQHIQRAEQLDAGWLVKPVQDDQFRTFVQTVLLWQPRAKEILQGSCNPLAIDASPILGASVGSSIMPSAVAPAESGFLLAAFRQLAAYIPAIAQLDPALLKGTMQDQDAADIRFACNQARIELADVLSLSERDQDMEQKRRHFVRVLFQRGWALPQVRRFVPVSDSYLEKERAAARKSCKDRAMVLR